MANTIGPKSAPHSRALCTPYVTIIGIGFPSVTKRKRCRSNFGAHVYFIRSSYINPQSVYIQRRQPSRTEIDNAARSLLQLRMDLNSRDFATVRSRLRPIRTNQAGIKHSGASNVQIIRWSSVMSYIYIQRMRESSGGSHASIVAHGSREGNRVVDIER